MDEHRAIKAKAKAAASKEESIEIMKTSKIYQRNNSEAARTNNRKWKEKNAHNDVQWPESPLGTLLLEMKDDFKEFVDGLPLYDGGQYPQSKTFHQILNQHPGTYCILDSAATPAPWPQIDTPAYSNDPRDLGIFSFYSIQHQWTTFYRKTKGYPVQVKRDDKGRFLGVDGVHWRVLRWKGGRNSWMNPAFTISDTVLPELQAFQLLGQLTEGLDVIEFGKTGGIDVLRINGLLDILKLPGLRFFNIGSGITYAQTQPRAVFGPRGMVRTPSAALENITNRLFDPKNSLFVPMSDVGKTDEPPSDVQRTWNLLMLFCLVYHS